MFRKTFSLIIAAVFLAQNGIGPVFAKEALSKSGPSKGRSKGAGSACAPLQAQADQVKTPEEAAKLNASVQSQIQQLRTQVKAKEEETKRNRQYRSEAFKNWLEAQKLYQGALGGGDKNSTASAKESLKKNEELMNALDGYQNVIAEEIKKLYEDISCLQAVSASPCLGALAKLPNAVKRKYSKGEPGKGSAEPGLPSFQEAGEVGRARGQAIIDGRLEDLKTTGRVETEQGKGPALTEAQRKAKEEFQKKYGGKLGSDKQFYERIQKCLSGASGGQRCLDTQFNADERKRIKALWDETGKKRTKLSDEISKKLSAAGNQLACVNALAEDIASLYELPPEGAPPTVDVYAPDMEKLEKEAKERDEALKAEAEKQRLAQDKTAAQEDDLKARQRQAEREAVSDTALGRWWNAARDVNETVGSWLDEKSKPVSKWLDESVVGDAGRFVEGKANAFGQYLRDLQEDRSFQPTREEMGKSVLSLPSMSELKNTFITSGAAVGEVANNYVLDGAKAAQGDMQAALQFGEKTFMAVGMSTMLVNPASAGLLARGLMYADVPGSAFFAVRSTGRLIEEPSFANVGWLVGDVVGGGVSAHQARLAARSVKEGSSGLKLASARMELETAEAAKAVKERELYELASKTATKPEDWIKAADQTASAPQPGGILSPFRWGPEAPKMPELPANLSASRRQTIEKGFQDLVEAKKAEAAAQGQFDLARKDHFGRLGPLEPQPTPAASQAKIRTISPEEGLPMPGGPEIRVKTDVPEKPGTLWRQTLEEHQQGKLAKLPEEPPVPPARPPKEELALGRTEPPAPEAVSKAEKELAQHQKGAAPAPEAGRLERPVEPPQELRGIEADAGASGLAQAAERASVRLPETPGFAGGTGFSSQEKNILRDYVLRQEDLVKQGHSRADAGRLAQETLEKRFPPDRHPSIAKKIEDLSSRGYFGKVEDLNKGRLESAAEAAKGVQAPRAPPSAHIVSGRAAVEQPPIIARGPQARAPAAIGGEAPGARIRAGPEGPKGPTGGGPEIPPGGVRSAGAGAEGAAEPAKRIRGFGDEISRQKDAQDILAQRSTTKLSPEEAKKVEGLYPLSERNSKEIVTVRSAGDLIPGQRYNYVIFKDGHMEVAPILKAGEEKGIKHYQIADNREVSYAGTIIKDKAGDIKIDMQSGTFARKDGKVLDEWRYGEKNATLLNNTAGKILDGKVTVYDPMLGRPAPIAKAQTAEDASQAAAAMAARKTQEAQDLKEVQKTARDIANRQWGPFADSSLNSHQAAAMTDLKITKGEGLTSRELELLKKYPDATFQELKKAMEEMGFPPPQRAKRAPSPGKYFDDAAAARRELGISEDMLDLNLNRGHEVGGGVNPHWVREVNGKKLHFKEISAYPPEKAAMINPKLAQLTPEERIANELAARAYYKRFSGLGVTDDISVVRIKDKYILITPDMADSIPSNLELVGRRLKQEDRIDIMIGHLATGGVDDHAANLRLLNETGEVRILDREGSWLTRDPFSVDDKFVAERMQKGFPGMPRDPAEKAAYMDRFKQVREDFLKTKNEFRNELLGTGLTQERADKIIGNIEQNLDPKNFERNLDRYFANLDSPDNPFRKGAAPEKEGLVQKLKNIIQGEGGGAPPQGPRMMARPGELPSPGAQRGLSPQMALGRVFGGVGDDARAARAARTAEGVEGIRYAMAGLGVPIPPAVRHPKVLGFVPKSEPSQMLKLREDFLHAAAKAESSPGGLENAMEQAAKANGLDAERLAQLRKEGFFENAIGTNDRFLEFHGKNAQELLAQIPPPIKHPLGFVAGAEPENMRLLREDFVKARAQAASDEQAINLLVKDKKLSPAQASELKQNGFFADAAKRNEAYLDFHQNRRLEAGVRAGAGAQPPPAAGARGIAKQPEIMAQAPPGTRAQAGQPPQPGAGKAADSAGPTARAGQAGGQPPAPPSRPALGGAPGGEPRKGFLTPQEAKQALSEAAPKAEARLDEIEKMRAQKGLPPLTEAEKQDIFLKRLYREMNPEGFVGRKKGQGGIVVLDTDAGVQKLRYEGDVFVDHHGRFYDPKNPEVDTTMQLLSRIERSAKEGKGLDDALDSLKQRFQTFSTDNLGDGAWSVWILENLDTVTRSRSLRDTIRLATHYEDFGVFGSKFLDDLAALKKTDPARYEKLRGAIELQDAVFNGYNKALASGKYGKIADATGMDRFGHLPAEKQRELMKEVQQHITKAVWDADFRRTQALEFKQAREAAKTTAGKADLNDWAKGVLKGNNLDPKLLDDLHVYDKNIFTGKQGLFADWGAVPLSHDKPLQIGFQKLEEGRTGFILAVPNGRKAESLKFIGEAVSKAEADKVAKLIKEGKLPADAKPGMVFGRDALQLSGPGGLHLTRDEIATAIGRARAEGQGGALAGARPPRVPDASQAAAPAAKTAVSPPPEAEPFKLPKAEEIDRVRRIEAAPSGPKAVIDGQEVQITRRDMEVERFLRENPGYQPPPPHLNPHEPVKLPESYAPIREGEPIVGKQGSMTPIEVRGGKKIGQKTLNKGVPIEALRGQARDTIVVQQAEEALRKQGLLPPKDLSRVRTAEAVAYGTDKSGKEVFLMEWVEGGVPLSKAEGLKEADLAPLEEYLRVMREERGIKFYDLTSDNILVVKSKDGKPGFVIIDVNIEGESVLARRAHNVAPEEAIPRIKKYLSTPPIVRDFEATYRKLGMSMEDVKKWSRDDKDSLIKAFLSEKKYPPDQVHELKVQIGLEAPGTAKAAEALGGLEIERFERTKLTPQAEAEVARQKGLLARLIEPLYPPAKSDSAARLKTQADDLARRPAGAPLPAAGPAQPYRPGQLPTAEEIERVRRIEAAPDGAKVEISPRDQEVHRFLQENPGYRPLSEAPEAVRKPPTYADFVEHAKKASKLSDEAFDRLPTQMKRVYFEDFARKHHLPAQTNQAVQDKLFYLEDFRKELKNVHGVELGGLSPRQRDYYLDLYRKKNPLLPESAYQGIKSNLEFAPPALKDLPDSRLRLASTEKMLSDPAADAYATAYVAKGKTAEGRDVVHKWLREDMDPKLLELEAQKSAQAQEALRSAKPGEFPSGVRLQESVYRVIDGKPVLVSDWLPGHTLDEVLAGKAAVRVGSEDFKRLEDFMQALHKKGYAHGDLHARNIQVFKDPSTSRLEFAILDMESFKKGDEVLFYVRKDPQTGRFTGAFYRDNVAPGLHPVTAAQGDLAELQKIKKQLMEKEASESGLMARMKRLFSQDRPAGMAKPSRKPAEIPEIKPAKSVLKELHPAKPGSAAQIQSTYLYENAKGKKLAAKTLKPKQNPATLRSEAEILRRIELAMDQAARYGHPFPSNFKVPRLVDYGQMDSSLLRGGKARKIETLVMERAQGKPLLDYLQEGGKVPKKDWDRFREGVSRLHDHGIVHGDIHMENIYVHRDPKTGEAVFTLLDFSEGRKLGRIDTDAELFLARQLDNDQLKYAIEIEIHKHNALLDAPEASSWQRTGRRSSLRKFEEDVHSLFKEEGPASGVEWTHKSVVDDLIKRLETAENLPTQDHFERAKDLYRQAGGAASLPRREALVRDALEEFRKGLNKAFEGQHPELKELWMREAALTPQEKLIVTAHYLKAKHGMDISNFKLQEILKPHLAAGPPADLLQLERSLKGDLPPLWKRAQDELNEQLSRRYLGEAPEGAQDYLKIESAISERMKDPQFMEKALQELRKRGIGTEVACQEGPTCVLHAVRNAFFGSQTSIDDLQALAQQIHNPRGGELLDEFGRMRRGLHPDEQEALIKAAIDRVWGGEGQIKQVMFHNLLDEIQRSPRKRVFITMDMAQTDAAAGEIRLGRHAVAVGEPVEIGGRAYFTVFDSGDAIVGPPKMVSPEELSKLMGGGAFTILSKDEPLFRGLQKAGGALDSGPAAAGRLAPSKKILGATAGALLIGGVQAELARAAGDLRHEGPSPQPASKISLETLIREQNRSVEEHFKKTFDTYLKATRLQGSDSAKAKKLEQDALEEMQEGLAKALLGKYSKLDLEWNESMALTPAEKLMVAHKHIEKNYGLNIANKDVLKNLLPAMPQTPAPLSRKLLPKNEWDEAEAEFRRSLDARFKSSTGPSEEFRPKDYPRGSHILDEIGLARNEDPEFKREAEKALQREGIPAEVTSQGDEPACALYGIQHAFGGNIGLEELRRKAEDASDPEKYGPLIGSSGKLIRGLRPSEEEALLKDLFEETPLEARKLSFDDDIVEAVRESPSGRVYGGVRVPGPGGIVDDHAIAIGKPVKINGQTYFTTFDSRTTFPVFRTPEELALLLHGWLYTIKRKG